ncbi:hypothetical protein [Kribbella caucasensis]|uniref:hypothetical protein n=1 Tax=Kribbella caucasensis TaxID=2512215 RepID=UPI00105EC9D3|nr:hypothetical protein [Kribbella sp. VKM Ac-2527]
MTTIIPGGVNWWPVWSRSVWLRSAGTLPLAAMTANTARPPPRCFGGCGSCPQPRPLSGTAYWLGGTAWFPAEVVRRTAVPR